MSRCNLLILFVLPLVVSADKFALIKTAKSACLGSFLDLDYVLTSASCVEGNEPREVVLFEGSKVSNKSLKVVTSFVHPNYDSITSDNNLAMLRLDPTAKNTGHLYTVLEPLPSFSMCELMLLEYDKEEKEYGIQSMNLTTMQNALCNTTQAGSLLRENSFCATVQLLAGNPARCQKGVGSPLICHGKLAGLLARSSECTPEMTNVGVYTDLSRFNNWIDDVFKTPATTSTPEPLTEAVTEGVVVTPEAPTKTTRRPPPSPSSTDKIKLPSSTPKPKPKPSSTIPVKVVKADPPEVTETPPEVKTMPQVEEISTQRTTPEAPERPTEAISDVVTPIPTIPDEVKTFCTPDNRNCMQEWRFLHRDGYEISSHKCINDDQIYTCLYVKKQVVAVDPQDLKIFNTHNHYYFKNTSPSALKFILPVPNLDAMLSKLDT